MKMTKINFKMKVLIFCIFISISMFLTSCNKDEIIKSGNVDKINMEKEQENNSNELVKKENSEPTKEKIDKIISDFDLLGLDNYKIDKENSNYLIHNEENKLLIDQDYNVISVEQKISIYSESPSKYKSLDEFIKMLFDKKYIDEKYEYNRKYPILEEGYNVYISKKYKSGIFNPFDGINFSYNTVNNRVVSYSKRNEYIAKDTPQLTIEEALLIAKDAAKKYYKSTDISKVLNKDYLVVSESQYPILEEKGKKYNEVYLIGFKECSVLIDANTKEVLFIDVKKSS